MKVKPEKNKKYLEYPVQNEYFRRYRFFLLPLTAIGIGGSVLCTQVLAGTENEKAKTKEEKGCSEETKKIVLALAGELGDKDFKVRKNATFKLIEIGKWKDKNKKRPYQTLVINEMKKCEKSKDPEISQRAEFIITALKTTSPSENTPRPPGAPPALKGKIRMEPK